MAYILLRTLIRRLRHSPPGHDEGQADDAEAGEEGNAEAKVARRHCER